MTESQTETGSDIEKFEISIEKLESIVKSLEADDISLERSLQAFKEGISLIRNLQEVLRRAEQHVSTLRHDDREAVSISNDSEVSVD